MKDDYKCMTFAEKIKSRINNSPVKQMVIKGSDIKDFGNFSKVS